MRVKEHHTTIDMKIILRSISFLSYVLKESIYQMVAGTVVMICFAFCFDFFE
jgi:hypothetical protein